MSKVSQALGALKTLSEQIHEQQLRAEERLKAQHGRFNVFTTLLKANDEVRLHTRFIHELLNPKGTHDCGDLFLKLFFETLNELPALDHDDSPTEENTWAEYKAQSYRVGKEERKGNHGQLDLLLESDSHLLVIENKIWANEQENQVCRYIEYLDSQKSHIGQVLYLTLDGKQAETHNDRAYLRISYKEHITAWVERCLQATYNIVPINQVLIQYNKVVQKLTKQDLGISTMDTIKDYIRHNPSIIEHQSAVSNAIQAMRVEVLNNFAEALIKRLDDQYSVTYRPHMPRSFGEDPYGGLVIRSKSNDITANHPFDIWIVHYQKAKALIIGIESNWRKGRPLSDSEKQLLFNLRERLLKRCSEERLQHATDQCIWGDTHWPTSWHDLINPFMGDDAYLAKLLDATFFQEQVELVEDGIRNYMSLLEALYSKVAISNQAETTTKG